MTTHLKNSALPSEAPTEGVLQASEPTLRYYDLNKNWRKVKRHLSDPTLNDILVEGFNKYTFGRWNKRFRHGDYPAEFESCDWLAMEYEENPEFRFCDYMRYVKHGACHWLVNFALRLAMLVEPNRDWRIITSDDHSTVWDGCETLFEFNFQAFGIPAEDCFHAAYDEELLPGEYIETDFAPHYTEDLKPHPEPTEPAVIGTGA